MFKFIPMAAMQCLILPAGGANSVAVFSAQLGTPVRVQDCAFWGEKWHSVAVRSRGVWYAAWLRRGSFGGTTVCYSHLNNDTNV